MGIQYAMYLYTRVEEVENLLRATALELAEDDKQRLLNALPYEAATIHSFISDWRTSPGNLYIGVQGLADEDDESERDRWVCLVFLVPVYSNETQPATLVREGCFYLSVTAGEKYAQACFSAATFDLSIVMAERMQGIFQRIAQACNALYGYIDVESSYVLRFPDLTQVEIVPEYTYMLDEDEREEIDGCLDVDFYVAALIDAGFIPAP